MDRRSLVVGGGAAAIATALGAVANGRNSPASASTIGAGPTSTADHAQGFLENLDVELGLVDADAAQRMMTDSFGVYLASDPRDPKANDLHAWAQQRIADLTGTDDIEAAVTKIPQTRKLLATSFLIYTQQKDLQLPKITRSMSVPARLVKLEPDFFPELLRQIDAKSESSRGFADLLQAGSAELDRFLATVSDDFATSATATNRGLEGATLVALVFIAVAAIVEKRNK